MVDNVKRGSPTRRSWCQSHRGGRYYKVSLRIFQIETRTLDEELNSPGVQKLLLDYLARAEEENTTLKSFRDRFHEADKSNGVLNEKLKKNRGIEVISVATLTIGAAIAGFAPSLWKDQPAGWAAIAFGAGLVIAGILAKVVGI